MANKYDDETTEVFRQVAKTLWLLRNQSGLTQEGLAEKARIKRTTISYIEQGRWNFSIATLAMLAKYFEVPIFRFFQRGNISSRPLEEEALILGKNRKKLFANLPAGVSCELLRLPKNQVIDLEIGSVSQLAIYLDRGEIVVNGRDSYAHLLAGQTTTISGPDIIRINNVAGEVRVKQKAKSARILIMKAYKSEC